MKRFILTIGLMMLCGCSGGADRVANPPTSNSTQPVMASDAGALQQAASQTYAKYMHASASAAKPQLADEIPQEYWADPIKALKPIRVYKHRVNIVVVQRVKDEVEEGKYIYIPISSYLPEDGVDGFRLTPNPLQGNTYRLGTGVFDYRRRLK